MRRIERILLKKQISAKKRELLEIGPDFRIGRSPIFEENIVKYPGDWIPQCKVFFSRKTRNKLPLDYDEKF